MQKSMHFYRVQAIKQVDSEEGEKLPAQSVDLRQILEEIYKRTNLKPDLSTLRKVVKQRDLALTIYSPDGRFYKGRFCIIKDGPLSEGVVENEDGVEEIGNVYANDNTRLLFKTVAFVYDSRDNIIGLSMNCNSMLEDYLNAFNNEQDFNVDEIKILQDEVVIGISSLEAGELINSLLIEVKASDAKSIEGDDWIAKYVRALGELTREAVVSLKITPELTAGGSVVLLTRESLGLFWDANKDRIENLEINPNRKGSLKFGSQNHIKKFDTDKDGDVFNAAELNDKAIEYLGREE